MSKFARRLSSHAAYGLVTSLLFTMGVTVAGSTVAQASNDWVQVGSDVDGDAANDILGYSVAMASDGSRIAVGALGNDTNGSDAGQVRVYDMSTSALTQVGADINGEAAGDKSGYSVSLSADGTRVAIGAPYNDNANGSNSGHVRVYGWSGSAWVQVGADINGVAATEYAGTSVSLSANGSRLAIGAWGNTTGGSFAGAVRVYDWNGTAWVQAGNTLTGDAAFDSFGTSVSLSADGARMAVGAPEHSSSAGLVRVYDWNGSAWVQAGSDIDGEAAGDQSGISVSLSADGSRVAIGAPGNDDNGGGNGHVRVYGWSGSAWVQVGTDIDGEAATDQAGMSVSLSANGSRMAVGAWQANGGAIDNGDVRVFDWSGSAWVQVGADINGEAAGDKSGFALALSGEGSRIVIGAYFNEATGTQSGHARAYRLPAALVGAPGSASYKALNKKVTVQWSAVSGAASYVVTTSAGAEKCTSTTTSCEVSGLRNGKAYTYLVYAVNSDGVRSAEATRVTVRPGFQVKRTSLKVRRSLALSSIVTTPSKGAKSWRVTSGKCRIQGSRLVAPTTKGTCKLRLATAKRGSYAAMSTTITITITK